MAKIFTVEVKVSSEVVGCKQDQKIYKNEKGGYAASKNIIEFKILKVL